MSSVKSLPAVFSTSVGRKVVVAFSGLFLCVFLIAHLSGNFLLVADDGGAKFNAYAEFMKSNPIIWVSEVIMFSFFLIHAVYALGLALYNNKARPIAYKKSAGAENSSFYSRFMVYSGSMTLIFLLIHLVQFFIHKLPWFALDEGDTIYHLVIRTFEFAPYSIFYIVCMIMLSFHLSHGVQSLFQTLGLAVNKSTEAKFKQLAWGFSILICGGFAFIPLYILLRSL